MPLYVLAGVSSGAGIGRQERQAFSDNRQLAARVGETTLIRVRERNENENGKTCQGKGLFNGVT